MREVLLLTAKVLVLIAVGGSIFCYTFREELKKQIAFLLDLLNIGRVTEERRSLLEGQNPEAEERKARRLAFWVLTGAIIFSAAEFMALSLAVDMVFPFTGAWCVALGLLVVFGVLGILMEANAGGSRLRLWLLGTVFSMLAFVAALLAALRVQIWREQHGALGELGQLAPYLTFALALAMPIASFHSWGYAAPRVLVPLLEWLRHLLTFPENCKREAWAQMLALCVDMAARPTEVVVRYAGELVQFVLRLPGRILSGVGAGAVGLKRYLKGQYEAVQSWRQRRAAEKERQRQIRLRRQAEEEWVRSMRRRPVLAPRRDEVYDDQIIFH